MHNPEDPDDTILYAFSAFMLIILVIGAIILLCVRASSKEPPKVKACDRYDADDYFWNRIPYRCKDVIIFFSELKEEKK